MIKFKEGVNPHDTHPSIWIALGIAYQIRCRITPLELVITSMNDGSHGATSLHYPQNSPDRLCRAVDLRNHDMSKTLRSIWASDCKDALEPMGYDVINHTGEDGVPIHLHIEYQPKPGEVDWIKL
jgi:hypothetical protein